MGFGQQSDLVVCTNVSQLEETLVCPPSVLVDSLQVLQLSSTDMTVRLNDYFKLAIAVNVRVIGDQSRVYRVPCPTAASAQP